MNYYIQGDAANADQIKAAFENKGFKFLTGSPSADKCNYHYTFMTKKGFLHHHNDNLVYCLPRGEWEAQVILNHPDYQELELPVKPHYDISNFNPFDKVLVRCSNDEEWMIEFYCTYDTLVHTSPHRDYPFMGICDSYSQCIPYNDDTKHLLGTTDMCPEEYINW